MPEELSNSELPEQAVATSMLQEKEESEKSGSGDEEEVVQAKVITAAERMTKGRGRGRGSRGGRASVASRGASQIEEDVSHSQITAPKSRRGRSKKSEIPATQNNDDEEVVLPVIEEDPSPKKRRG